MSMPTDIKQKCASHSQLDAQFFCTICLVPLCTACSHYSNHKTIYLQTYHRINTALQNYKQEESNPNDAQFTQLLSGTMPAEEARNFIQTLISIKNNENGKILTTKEFCCLNYQNESIISLEKRTLKLENFIESFQDSVTIRINKEMEKYRPGQKVLVGLQNDQSYVERFVIKHICKKLAAKLNDKLTESCNDYSHSISVILDQLLKKQSTKYHLDKAAEENVKMHFKIFYIKILLKNPQLTLIVVKQVFKSLEISAFSPNDICNLLKDFIQRLKSLFTIPSNEIQPIIDLLKEQFIILLKELHGVDLFEKIVDHIINSMKANKEKMITQIESLNIQEFISKELELYEKEIIFKESEKSSIVEMIRKQYTQQNIDDISDVINSEAINAGKIELDDTHFSIVLQKLDKEIKAHKLTKLDKDNQIIKKCQKSLLAKLISLYPKVIDVIMFQLNETLIKTMPSQQNLLACFDTSEMEKAIDCSLNDFILESAIKNEILKTYMEKFCCALPINSMIVIANYSIYKLLFKISKEYIPINDFQLICLNTIAELGLPISGKIKEGILMYFKENFCNIANKINLIDITKYISSIVMKDVCQLERENFKKSVISEQRIVTECNGLISQYSQFIFISNDLLSNITTNFNEQFIEESSKLIPFDAENLIVQWFFQSVRIQSINKELLENINGNSNQVILQLLTRNLTTLKIRSDIFKNKEQFLLQIQKLRKVKKLLKSDGKNKEDLSKSYDEALQIAINVLGQCHPDVVSIYIFQAKMYESANEYNRALQSYENVIQIVKSTSLKLCEKLELYYHLGICNYKLCKYQSAIDSLLSCINEFGNTPISIDLIISVYNCIGICYNSLKDYKNSLKYYSDLLQIVQIKNEASNELLSSLHYNVGASHQANNDQKNALLHFNDSLQLKIKALGQSHPDVASIYNKISTSYKFLKNYEQSIKYSNEALQIYTTLYGRTHNAIATTHCIIADSYERLNDTENALMNYNEALDILQSLYGNESSEISSVYYSIGFLCRKMNMHTKAIENFKKVLEISTKLNGKNHIEVGNALHQIGISYENLCFYEQAIENYEEAIKVRTNVHGHDSIEVAATYGKLGNSYYNIKDYENALRYFNEHLQISSNVYGNFHNEVALGYHNLGITYEKMRNYESTLKNYTEALQIRIKLYGKDNAKVALVYNNIGITYCNLKDFKSALVQFNQALQIRINIFGAVTSDVASVYFNIGNANYSLKNYEIALQNYKASCDIVVKIGKDMVMVGKCNNCIGLCHFNLRDYNKAISYFNEALVIYKQLYGEKHSAIADAYKNISMAYKCLNDNSNFLRFSMEFQSSMQY